MSRKIKIQISARSKRIAKICAIVFGVSLIAFVATVSAYAYDYQNKVLPKVYYGRLNVSGKSKQELKAGIARVEEDHKGDKIRLLYNDKNWEMKFEDLGWQLPKDKLTDKIYSYGHSADWKQNIWPLLKQIVVKKEFSLGYDFNASAAEDWLNSINSEIGSPKREANLLVKGDNVKVIEPSQGKKIDDLKVKKEIVDHMELIRSGDMTIELIQDDPTIMVDEAEKLKDKAKELSSSDLVLVGPKGEATVSSTTLGTYIELKRETKEKKTFLSFERTLGPTFVSFSSEKLRTFIEKESDELNIEPVDAKFAISDGKVSVYKPSSDGKVVKLDEAVDLIVKTLEENSSKRIELPYETKEASIAARTSADIEKYGIKELIGTATTDFSKSPQNRIHNIQVGVQSLSGALIKPGEEFSTLVHLGSIDASSGYLQELVIKENETKPEFGGGLCQVSTTLFRSAMNAGLKITERQNHSYRVSYYEPPVGMDATIYSPKPDLKFLNDTSAYILLQGRVEGNKITFDFFGTKDGREVSISSPEVFDVTPPPAPIYIDDPSLELGEEIRIDRAHNGAKAFFYYKVTKNGKEYINEKFVSSYVPWPAKYRRGPQPEAAPSAEASPSP